MSDDTPANPFAHAARRRRRFTPEQWAWKTTVFLGELRDAAAEAIDAAEARAAAALYAAQQGAVGDLVALLPPGSVVVVVPPRERA